VAVDARRRFALLPEAAKILDGARGSAIPFADEKQAVPEPSPRADSDQHVDARFALPAVTTKVSHGLSEAAPFRS
jgi:hypothetical protein